MGANYGSDVAIDAVNAYWTNTMLGGVVKASLAGGDPVLISATNEGGIPLTVNSTEVFWTTGGGLHRVLISGGATEVTTLNGNPGLFVDDEHAYYTAFRPQGDDASTAVQPVLEEMNLATKAVRRIAEGPRALSLVAVGSDIFGTTCGQDGVWRASSVDGSVTTLVIDIESRCPMQLVAADGSLYFSDVDVASLNGSFRRLRCVGGEPETLATTAGYFEFAIDGAFAYLLVQGMPGKGDSVVRVPLDGGDGGGGVEIATAKNTCTGIGVSGNSVYWLEGSSGNCGAGFDVIRSIAK